MTQTVWLNGCLTPSDEARIDPSDRGFTLGDGVFETIRARNGMPFHLARHLARLVEGARILGIPVPHSETALALAIEDVLRANGLDRAAVRLTLSRGPAPRGVLPTGDVRPTLLITAGTLPGPLPPARVIVAQGVRRNEFSPLSRIKSLNYLDSVLARCEAAAAGADDALLLNTRGNLAEASTANLFLYVDGRWITPAVADGALPGIARGLLLESGPVGEACIDMDCLKRAEAGVLTNSLAHRRLASIGGTVLNSAHTAFAALDPN
jgi:branched-chain amino acid aminotransferase